VTLLSALKPCCPPLLSISLSLPRLKRTFFQTMFGKANAAVGHPGQGKLQSGHIAAGSSTSGSHPAVGPRVLLSAARSVGVTAYRAGGLRREHRGAVRHDRPPGQSLPDQILPAGSSTPNQPDFKLDTPYGNHPSFLARKRPALKGQPGSSKPLTGRSPLSASSHPGPYAGLHSALRPAKSLSPVPQGRRIPPRPSAVPRRQLVEPGLQDVQFLVASPPAIGPDHGHEAVAFHPPETTRVASVDAPTLGSGQLLRFKRHQRGVDNDLNGSSGRDPGHRPAAGIVLRQPDRAPLSSPFGRVSTWPRWPSARSLHQLGGSGGLVSSPAFLMFIFRLAARRGLQQPSSSWMTMIREDAPSLRACREAVVQGTDITGTTVTSAVLVLAGDRFPGLAASRELCGGTQSVISSWRSRSAS